MHKITELIGKKLIDVDTARDLGQIRGVAWSKAVGNCAIVTDGGTFKAETIFAVKDAASIVKAEATDDYTDLTLGKTAYDTTGKYLGKIYEVEFGNTLKPSKITLIDGTEYGRGKIYAVKDVALIRARTPASKKPVATATATSTQSNTAKLKLKQKSYSPWMQNRKYGDFSFLIGKITDKTITNFQGEVMVKYGEKVTQDVLRQAKISGKLIELCLHTK